MAKLKKINNEWQPSENPGLEVGEIIEITDYQRLVKSGMASLVDDNGNELPLPGQKFSCPICFKDTSSLEEFVSHIDSHKKEETKIEEPEQKIEVVEEVIKESPVTTPAPVSVEVESITETPTLSPEEELKAKRIANLAKARAARGK